MQCAANEKVFPDGTTFVEKLRPFRRYPAENHRFFPQDSPKLSTLTAPSWKNFRFVPLRTYRKNRKNRKRPRPDGRERQLVENLPQRRPRSVPSPAGDGIQSKSVISGDMCLGNDTSHDGWGDYFARNRIPSIMQLFVEKGQRPFPTGSKKLPRPDGRGRESAGRFYL